MDIDYLAILYPFHFKMQVLVPEVNFSIKLLKKVLLNKKRSPKKNNNSH